MIDAIIITQELMKLTKEQIESSPNSSVLNSMRMWYSKNNTLSVKQLTYTAGLLLPFTKVFTKSDVSDFIKNINTPQKGLCALKTRYLGSGVLELLSATKLFSKEVMKSVKRMEGFTLEDGRTTVKLSYVNVYLLRTLGFSIDEETQKIIEVPYQGRIKGVDSIVAKLYDYQLDGVSFMQTRNGNVLLADGMGVGKTLETLTFIEKNKLFPAFIICPQSLKLNWKKEIEKWCKKKQKIEVLSGRKGDIKKLGDYWNILNYDIVDGWCEAIIRKQEKYASKHGLNNYVGILVMDESHKIKNESTKQTIACMDIARVPRTGSKEKEKKRRKQPTFLNPTIKPRIMCVSGTPIENRVMEFFTSLTMIAPALFPNRFEYGLKFCGGKKGRWGWDFSGSSNLYELHHMLTSTVMIRRLKSDVLKELPTKQRIVIPLEMSAKAKKEYEEANKNFLEWLKKQNENKAVNAAKAEAITKLNYLKHIIARAKMDDVFEWIDNFLESDEKLGIFAVHRDIVAEIHKRYPDISVVLTGETSMEARQAAVDRFQTDSKTKLFITTHKAGGVGITLTAASHMCVLEFGWTPSEHDQSEDRFLRIGATADSVNCYYFACQNTIEEKIIDLLDKKRKVINKVMEGDSHEEYGLLGDLLEDMLRNNS